MAQRVKDLVVYTKAGQAFQAINTLIEGTDIRKNFKLRDQLEDAAASMSESDLSLHDRMYDEIMAMLIGWIRYLRRSDRKDRLIGGRSFDKNSPDPPIGS